MSFTVGLDVSALDATFKNHSQRGIGRYVGELVRYFEAQGYFEEALDQKKSGEGSNSATSGDERKVQLRRFDHTSFAPPAWLERLIACAPAGRQTLRQQIVYPLALSGNGSRYGQVLHFPAHMDAPSWSAARCIVTVLDLIPFKLRELYRPEQPGWRFDLARWLEVRAIRRAALILAISRTTADDVVSLLGIPEERVIVTPLGVDEKFFSAELREKEEDVRARYGIAVGRPVVLYVGGIDQRKNWRGLLETARQVVDQARERGAALPLFVMAGRIAQDRQYPHLLSVRQGLGLETDVHFTEFVPDEDLLQLFALSSAFFFPSLYEGFGLPPLEAMAAGVPVVSSNRACLPEVLGEAALFADPDNSAECAARIAAVLESPSLARGLREEGRAQARKFRWSDTGKRTYEAYCRFAAGEFER